MVIGWLTVITGGGFVGVVRTGWDAETAPAESLLTILIIVAGCRTLAVEAQSVSTAVVVVATGDETITVVTEAAVTAVIVFVTSSTDHAATVVADLTVGAFHVRRTQWHAVSIGITQFVIEAVARGVTAIRWFAFSTDALT